MSRPQHLVPGQAMRRVYYAASVFGLGLYLAALASGPMARDYSRSRISSDRYDLPPHVGAADYGRAERFLSWNRQRYVANADIQHHWIAANDRFWYARRKPTGEREFVMVDAMTGTQSAAFDHRHVAAALSLAVNAEVDAARLPFSSFRFLSGGREIEFTLEERVWTCRLDVAACSSMHPLRADHEVLSPDGRWAAFLHDHDVWIHAISTGKRFALTTDGVEHYAYASPPGYSTRHVRDARQGTRSRPHVIWSPDSRFLLTYRLDEREVKDLYLLESVPGDGDPRPRLHAYRYALPGDEHLPQLEPLVLDIATRSVVKLKTDPLICLPQTPIEKREMWWSADGQSVYYLKRDRYAKSVSLESASVRSGAVTQLVRESSDTIALNNADNVFEAPLVRTLRDGDIIWYSQRDGWGHLYYYDRTGALRNQITKGEWVVRGLVRIDENERRLYFMASGREPGRDPYEQRMYRARFDGSQLQLLTPEEADHRWHNPEAKWRNDGQHARELEEQQFSPSGRYFVDSYSRPDLPPVLVLRTASGQLIRRLEEADISQLREGGYTPIEPFRVYAADGKTPIYGNLHRPSTFDPARKYPVIDASYPGPQSIRTSKSFMGANFGKYEAQSLAELGFVVITIDGRGTPNRSKAFLNYSYGRLERASELEDHIAGIRELARRYSYMDLARVGIDGASSGGFSAAEAILVHPNFYKVAVAAQGNHDQRGYLAPWGDIYNGPAKQRDYAGSATPQLAANLRGKLLLMHGELDDNVSPTLTLRLVDALIKANKDFELLIIPGADHFAFASSQYFIRRKWDFFVRNLLGAEPPPNYWIQAR